MLPLLFSGTPFETPTYFALYLLGFLGAILLSTHTAKREGVSPVRAIDLGLFSFVLGFSGARIFHILAEAPAYYWENPIRVFYFWQGGFVLYGGLILGIVGGYCIVRFWWKESTSRWGNVVTAPIFLGIGIGRMGCLAAGCCYGRPTEAWWGMIFTNPQSGAPLHIALHPTQILEAFFCFAMAGLFYWMYQKPAKREGEPFMMGILAYSLFRFLIEYLRGDPERGFYFSSYFSTSQIVSLAAVFFVLVWLSFPKAFRWLFN